MPKKQRCADEPQRDGVRKRPRHAPLQGDVVCFTGVPSAEKQRLGARLTSNGAVVKDDLDDSVSVLVAGHSNTEKVKAAMTSAVVEAVVCLQWALDAADEALVARPDPGEKHYQMRALSSFTVILSTGLARAGADLDDTELVECILANGGQLGSEVISRSTQSARSAVVVKRHASTTTQEVMERAIVQVALKHCIPVVWQEWVYAVVDHGFITEESLSTHSLIESEPTAPTKLAQDMTQRMDAALAKPTGKSWARAPLHGVTLYVHRGDADNDVYNWLETCAIRLGACSANTVTALTTHIVMAAPDSRRALHNQRISQIIAGPMSVTASNAAFTERNVITGDWLFECFVQERKVATEGYLYSLVDSQHPAAADSTHAPSKPSGAPVQGLPIRGRGATVSSVSTSGGPTGPVNANTASGYTYDTATKKVAFTATPRSSLAGAVAAPAQDTPASQGSAVSRKDSEADAVAKAQRKFGRSDMFRGKVFIMSAGFAKGPKTTASRIILAHGGAVVREGKWRAEEGGAPPADYFVVPHFSSRDMKLAAAAAAPPVGMQVVTEDWLSVCYNYLAALRALETEANPKVLTSRVRYYGTSSFFPSAFMKADFAHAEARAWVSQRLSDVVSGAAPSRVLPDPTSHFLYCTAVLRRQFPSPAARGGGGQADAPPPSPFLEHGQLRSAKKHGVGVAVCFAGLAGIEKEHLTKVVVMIGGNVTPEFNKDVTTHVVLHTAFFENPTARSQRTLQAAIQAAEKGGDQIVLGVDVEWMKACAVAGYFVAETPYVLFPKRAKHFDELGDAPRAPGPPLGSAAPHNPSQASSEPTPVVPAKAKIMEQDPNTPSPRACLRFDSTVRRPGAREAEEDGASRKVFLALATKGSVVLQFQAVELLKETVAKLGGKVVDRCSEATHLVTSTLTTTENACIALAAGKWVLSPGWLAASAHHDAWQDEAQYELTPEVMRAAVQQQHGANVSMAPFEKTLQLASAVRHWRLNEGNAFRGWRVYLCADEVFAAVLASGGAVIVGRDLPPDWGDLAGAFVLMDKRRFAQLSPEWREAIGQVNSVHHRRREAKPPTTVGECSGFVLWIHIISAHLQRADFDYTKLLCGDFDRGTTLVDFPPVPC
eukprot:TRINITY_DN1705_c0_g4_i1.p1 TRINITY_DN1705_c0_g4~~TRINITY_DN1705_c0_g4_i1.p1  ORF type:complete len:1139 (+),score=291.27 TRINITY_DN1705_c0_g4_i1:71-3418(+)